MREMGAICQIGVHLETVHILGPKWVYFRPFHTTFSMIVAQIIVFIVISLFPTFLHCKNSYFSFQVLASCEKVTLGQNALFCSIWTQTRSAKRPF